MEDVAGKVAFVTGAASGMGLAIARSFAAAGMKVVLADVEEEALEEARASFGPTNADVIAVRVDVTDRDAMAAAADRTEETFGKVHVLVNNAGVAVGGSIADMAYTDWDWVVGVNLDGVVNGVQEFLPRILAHGEGGHIVNTASLAGLLPFGGLGVYNTTKFAVVGMSEALRADLAAQDIGVSVLCPGVVNTNIFESGRNRPAALQSETDTATLGLMDDEEGDEENRLRVEAARATALEPDVVGDMVLHGIQENEAYIFTHPEYVQAVSERQEEVSASFARWRAFREEQGI
ncbi:MAG: SDR family NAD(P)-dependent oxidoreductase [Gammaproteobacteria bacterium]|nr:SDR family NAD(P)-dependent oxidoreductase [Gammaproteobacteria bacterium]